MTPWFSQGCKILTKYWSTTTSSIVMVTAILKTQYFSHQSPTVVELPSLMEQFDIHHPAAEMARSHKKTEMCVLCLFCCRGVIITTNTSDQHNVFPSLLPTFCFSLTSTLFCYWCWAPFNGASTHGRSVSGYFLPSQFEIQFWRFFLLFLFVFLSRAAPVENKTFTILLGCKSELRDSNYVGCAPFMR